MKLAIIGSRGFSDYGHLSYVMTEWFGRYANDNPYSLVTEVISGGANGADKLGARWAKENNVKLTEFIPDWEKLGKRAGFVRNEDIVKASDCVLAFWDGVSRGTANSLSIAKRLKKPCLVIYF